MPVQGLYGAGMTPDGVGDIINPPRPDSTTILHTVDLVVIDNDIRNLILDLDILVNIVKVSKYSFVWLCGSNFLSIFIVNGGESLEIFINFVIQQLFYNILFNLRSAQIVLT